MYIFLWHLFQIFQSFSGDWIVGYVLNIFIREEDSEIVFVDSSWLRV